MRLSALLLILLIMPQPSYALIILYSNDVMGEVEPCGCRNNPAGGLPRISVFMESLGKESSLYLDAGDLYYPSESIAEPLREQNALQARHLRDGMNALGLDGFTPGEKDFVLGIEHFQKLRKKAKFYYLSANLYRGKKLFLRTHKIYTRKLKNGKKIKIGVFGLSGKDISWPVSLTVKDPIRAAKEQVKYLKKKSDLVIALTHQGGELDQELAEKVPGIDLIIGAHSQSFYQTPIVVGDTKIYQSSYRNQYIGVIPVEIPFTGKHHELFEISEEYEPKKDASQRTKKLVQLVETVKSEIAKLNTQTAKLARATPQSASGPFHTFPKCSQCHRTQFHFWRKTAHAIALSPLKKASQIRNKDCLKCHTLAMGSKLGYSHVDQMALKNGKHVSPETLESLFKKMHDSEKLDESLDRELAQLSRSFAPVQCENCHAPGGGHPFSSQTVYKKAVAQSACLSCHTRDQAPKWYLADGKPNLELIQQKIASISCPPDE